MWFKENDKRKSYVAKTEVNFFVSLAGRQCEHSPRRRLIEPGQTGCPGSGPFLSESDRR